MSTDQQPDMPDRDEGETTSEPKRVRVRLSDLRREPMDEEKAKSAEELRRLKMIAKGQHPDTGKPLRSGDASSFHSAIEQMQVQSDLLMREAERLNPIRDAARQAAILYLTKGATRASVAGIDRHARNDHQPH